MEIVDLSNIQLVTDMWTYLCLGLRPNELKRVRILTQEGKGAMLIKIREIKSQKTIIRYVPKSLIQLVTFSRVVYPMTEERIK